MRIARLEDENGFKNLATSAKKAPAARQQEIEAGQQRQEEIRALLRAFGKTSGQKLFKDRKEFLTALREVDRVQGVRLSAPELKAVLAALGERDETAEICRDRDGEPEPAVQRDFVADLCLGGVNPRVRHAAAPRV